MDYLKKSEREKKYVENRCYNLYLCNQKRKLNVISKGNISVLFIALAEQVHALVGEAQVRLVVGAAAVEEQPRRELREG